MNTKSKALPTLTGGDWKPSFNAPAWRRRAKGLAIPLALIALLEIVVRVGWIPSYQMPAPSEIVLTLRDLAGGSLWTHIGVSLARVLGGFVIGAGLALVIAAWVGLSREAEAYLEPTFAGLRAIPSLAWVPLLLLWLGIDETSKVVLIAIGAFFPVYVNGVAAIRNIDRKLVEVGRCMASVRAVWLYGFFCQQRCRVCSRGCAAA